MLSKRRVTSPVPQRKSRWKCGTRMAPRHAWWTRSARSYVAALGWVSSPPVVNDAPALESPRCQTGRRPTNETRPAAEDPVARCVGRRLPVAAPRHLRLSGGEGGELVVGEGEGGGGAVLLQVAHPAGARHGHHDRAPAQHPTHPPLRPSAPPAPPRHPAPP